jgi:hypothetical protein
VLGACTDVDGVKCDGEQSIRPDAFRGIVESVKGVPTPA